MLKIVTSYELKTSSPKDKVEEFIHFVEEHCPVNDTIQNPPAVSHEIIIK